jgi:predicted RNA-binding protein with PIN domain
MLEGVAAVSVDQPDDAHRRPESAVLPAGVRRLLVELAAEVLGALGETEVSAGLRKVRAFAPTRRARAAAAPLAMALDRDQTFRRQVAAAWRRANPELAEQLTDGRIAPALDPELVAAGLYLCRPEGWEPELDRWLAAVDAGQRVAERDEQAGRANVASEQIEAALGLARSELAVAEAAVAQLTDELSTLRREQRRLRSEADRARAAVREIERKAADEVERLSTALAERDGLVRDAESRAQEALDQLVSARRSVKDGRSLAELRARLLLDTIVESASALRRELALPPAGQAPADVVADQLTRDASTGPAVRLPARGLAADDPALLAEQLRVPRAHLLVDGYNVTMEGYGGLTLVDQRRLLIDALSALAARTSAEITCCFDGAEVDARSAGLVRGVRVLFSDPGMTADELIRRLVRAEPRGRMLVVASSDAEVAETAIAAGARSVSSTVLLRLLGAGQRDRRR